MFSKISAHYAQAGMTQVAEETNEERYLRCTENNICKIDFNGHSGIFRKGVIYSCDSALVVI